MTTIGLNSLRHPQRFGDNTNTGKIIHFRHTELVSAPHRQVPDFAFSQCSGLKRQQKSFGKKRTKPWPKALG